MLGNKFTVLDKGFIAYFGSSYNSKTMKDLCDGYFNTNFPNSMLDIAQHTFVIKCPLFIQIQLSQFDFKILTSTSSSDIEIYTPNISQIKGDNLEERQSVEEYIVQTVEALKLSATGLAMDGFSSEVAQSILPLSTYTTIIVHGSLRKWISLLNKQHSINSLNEYTSRIEELLKADWPNLNKIRSMVS